MKARSAWERTRAIEIATHMVTVQVSRGEVDPDDEEALSKAVREAASTAIQAIRAAEEFLCG